MTEEGEGVYQDVKDEDDKQRGKKEVKKHLSY